MPLVESFSGIRGIYDDGLDEQVALRYAYSYLSFLKNKYKKIKKIVVGTDTRPSKGIIKNSVIEALDCEIIDLGIASTPMVEFAVRHYKADGGIVVTASHNEPYWNGFKFLDKDGAILKAEDMDRVIKDYSKIKKLSNKGFALKYFNKNYNNNKIKNKNISLKNKKTINKNISVIKKINNKKFFNNHLYKNIDPNKLKIKKIIKRYNEINRTYSDFVLGFLSAEDKEKIKNSKLKIIIDPNGGTGIIAKQILEKLKVKVQGVNMKYGAFNRTIEPNEDSLLYLANMVREKDYDFAAGFDCDADRVEIMTSKGIVSGNHLLAIIANDILTNSKNKIIVVNNATSSMVKEIARKHNAKYVEVEVGEINVVDKMKSLKTPIGGEGSSSGVIIWPSRCRDGILTLIYLLKIIASKGKKIEELIKGLPKYCYLKEKVDIDSKKYNKIRGKIEDYYKNKGNKIIKLINNGGIKVFLNHSSFIWFRASKTEANVLRIIADSPSKEQANSIMEEALKIIK